jgi:hypothetical protein
MGQPYFILGRDRAQAIRWAIANGKSLQACNFLDGNSLDAASRLDFTSPHSGEVVLLSGWNENDRLREVSHYVVKKYIQQRRLPGLAIEEFE